jgi:hypothetical protein
MTTANLWSANTPAAFWQCEDTFSREQWEAAIAKATPSLALPDLPDDTDNLLASVLGEAQFGPRHWQLCPARRLYYYVKPVVPRRLVCLLRRLTQHRTRARAALNWPIEDRYARFLWEVMRQLLIAVGRQAVSFRFFWPEGHRFAFVLTHDVETAAGQACVRAVADLDERFGFRSSFNFVPERYPLDHHLMQELREHGFEVGVHGLAHDGKLFSCREGFTEGAKRINRHLKELHAVGFRAELTLRHPGWMQALDIMYDLSFFD